MKKSTKLLGLSAAAALLISAPAMAQDIKIGFLADLTGPIAGFAPGMVDTGNIALKNINDQGGILAGQNLVSVVADTGCDGSLGGPAGDRVVNTENVTAIFGAYCSGPTISSARRVTTVDVVSHSSPGSVVIERMMTDNGSDRSRFSATVVAVTMRSAPVSPSMASRTDSSTPSACRLSTASRIAVLPPAWR